MSIAGSVTKDTPPVGLAAEGYDAGQPNRILRASNTSKTAAEVMMEAETTVRYGCVPHRLYQEPLVDISWQMREDEFLFRGYGEHYFYYRCGEGVTIDRGAGAEIVAEPLWLKGSVYAAIACMNGLLPIHASAVAVNELVFAFTGPAGAGKSTLVAALGRCGIPMFCDDTLVLDISDPERIVCLPGHRRLKLSPAAAELTGSRSLERVALSIDKLYCLPPSGEVQGALPFRELIFLERGDGPSIYEMPPADAFLQLQDDHYTARLYATARNFDPRQNFAHLAQLASRVTATRFVQPHDLSLFNDGVSVVARHVKEAASRTVARTDEAH